MIMKEKKRPTQMYGNHREKLIWKSAQTLYFPVAKEFWAIPIFQLVNFLAIFAYLSKISCWFRICRLKCLKRVNDENRLKIENKKWLYMIRWTPVGRFQCLTENQSININTDFFFYLSGEREWLANNKFVND